MLTLWFLTNTSFYRLKHSSHFKMQENKEEIYGTCLVFVCEWNGQYKMGYVSQMSIQNISVAMREREFVVVFAPLKLENFLLLNILI